MSVVVQYLNSFIPVPHNTYNTSHNGHYSPVDVGILLLTGGPAQSWPHQHIVRVELLFTEQMEDNVTINGIYCYSMNLYSYWLSHYIKALYLYTQWYEEVTLIAHGYGHIK